MDIASHLGMGLSEVKRKTTSSEVPLWRVKLEKERLRTDSALFHAIARVALEVRGVLMKSTEFRKLTIEEFLPHLKIVRKDEVEEADPVKAREVRIAASKGFWGSLLSLGGRKKDGR